MTAVANQFSGSQRHPHQIHFARDMVVAYAVGWIAGTLWEEYRTRKNRYVIPMGTRREMNTKRRTGRWCPDIAVEDLHAWRDRMLYRMEYARQHDGLVPNDDGLTHSGLGGVIFGLRMIEDDIAITGAQPTP